MGFRHLFAAAGAEPDPESGRMDVRMCRDGGGVGRGGQKEPRAPIPVPADFPGGRLASGGKPGVSLLGPANGSWRSCPTSLLLLGGTGVRRKGMADPLQRLPPNPGGSPSIYLIPCAPF